MNKLIGKKSSGKGLTTKNLFDEEEFKECRCKQILVVDDNNFNIMAIQIILKQIEMKNAGLDLEVDTVSIIQSINMQAYDGMHAIEVMNNKIQSCMCKRGYLLAIIDLNMPRMGGTDMMKCLQDHFSDGKMMEHINTRFILSTAQSDGDSLDMNQFGFSSSCKYLMINKAMQ